MLQNWEIMPLQPMQKWLINYFSRYKMESVAVETEYEEGQLAIYRQLQKDFRFLRQVLDELAVGQDSIAGVSDSLINQAEQLECCKKVS